MKNEVFWSGSSFSSISEHTKIECEPKLQTNVTESCQQSFMMNLGFSLYFHGDIGAILILSELALTSLQFAFRIKTFYDVDLQTTHFFNNQSNSIDLCEELGTFYDARSTVMVLPRCIRFKSSQLLYCHGEMENYRNYSK